MDTQISESIHREEYEVADKLFWKYRGFKEVPSALGLSRKEALRVLEKRHSLGKVPNILDLPRTYFMFHYNKHYLLAVIVNLKKIDPSSKQEHG